MSVSTPTVPSIYLSAGRKHANVLRNIRAASRAQSRASLRHSKKNLSQSSPSKTRLIN